MHRVIPSWYFKGYYLQTLDGIPYKLKAAFDFSFLSRYGRVFKIFDDQDSGNICFGTERDGKLYFVKFAGAPTEAYTGTPQEAVDRLKATLPVYEALHHDHLIEFVKGEEIGGGFVLVFRWAAGDCMGRMWGSSRFQAPEEYRLGAEIDEITNVYTAGAFAFALFGGYSRRPEDWTLSEALFRVAARAVTDERKGRQQSIRQLKKEWEDAL